MKRHWILGSASPRRKKILSDLGITFDVATPQVEEVLYLYDPERTVKENSILKNKWCSELYPDSFIISADTVVVFETLCVMKPETIAEAYKFFDLFSGRTHKVITGVTLYRPNKETISEVVESEVTFKYIDRSIAADYFSKVNPMDKAGAYDIDQSTDLIIDSFSGSFTNIMGLPTELISQWIKDS